MKAIAIGLFTMLALGASVLNARAECLVETKAIVFPLYDVYATTPIDAVGTLSYKCTSDQVGVTTTFRIAIDPSPEGGFTRRMRRVTEALDYDLFLDPMRTMIWGNGAKGTFAYVGTCCAVGKYTTASIYARIPPGQDVSAGKYSDVLLVNFEF
ncbi:MAG: spore coat U domain-containing protein [Acidobacteriota bacterium]